VDKGDVLTLKINVKTSAYIPMLDCGGRAPKGALAMWRLIQEPVVVITRNPNPR
jgi:hypothetical protein